jgi:hypothetical protein
MCHARILTKQFQSYCNKSISDGSVTSVDQVEPFFLDFQSVPGLRNNTRNQGNVVLQVCYYYINRCDKIASVLFLEQD